jgi:cytochrome P450
MHLLESATVADLDLHDASFWARPYRERDETFAALRALPHPHFLRPPSMPGLGYFALVKHADIAEVSRRPQDFSSDGATTIVDLPPEFVEFYGSMINMDNPEHARLRRIVARAFGRGVSVEFEDTARRTARRIVDDLVERGPGDFVRPVAAEMPIAVLSTMMGIPSDDYQFLYERSNVIVGSLDPDYVPQSASPTLAAAAVLKASKDLGEYVARLGADRAAHPTGDLITKLVTAEIDGEQLTRQELVSFFILLVVAGMETTRNAISRALVLLTEHPDQKELLLSDFETHAPRAVEEMLRFATPINWMRRTATRDCEVNGHRFRQGDKVFLYYWSANRDEEVFAEPHRFDITRDPNPHLSFGSVGPHFCLGAHLARMEITAILRELLGRLPGIRADGNPRRIESSFIEGIKQLHCSF